MIEFNPQIEQNYVLVAIDPSINSMGYAIFINEKLSSYGTIKSSGEDKASTLVYRINKMVHDLATKLPGSKTKQTLIIEEPQMFDTATSSAAVHNSSLKKLLMVVGAVLWHGFLLQATVELIPVGTWKGQLPKSVTTKRSEAKFGVKFKTTDEADAVSLGDWYLTNRGKNEVETKTTEQVTG